MRWVRVRHFEMILTISTRTSVFTDVGRDTQRHSLVSTIAGDSMITSGRDFNIVARRSSNRAVTARGESRRKTTLPPGPAIFELNLPDFTGRLTPAPKPGPANAPILLNWFKEE